MATGRVCRSRWLIAMAWLTRTATARASPLDNDQGNGLAGKRDLQRRPAGCDVQARRRTGEPRQLTCRLAAVRIAPVKVLPGEPSRCHAVNALLWSASIR